MNGRILKSEQWVLFLRKNHIITLSIFIFTYAHNLSAEQTAFNCNKIVMFKIHLF